MRNKILITLLAAIILVGASGCIKFTKQPTTQSKLGGVFFTDDRFETWKTHSLLMTPGETAGSISGVDVYTMKFDPSDNEAIYVATRADGLYYSYNGGAGWNKSNKLPAGFIRDIVVDPSSKCVVYAAVENKLWKSNDCGRTWQNIYYTDNAEKKIAAMDIDWYDSKTLYAGLTDGSFIKSENSGVSWQLIQKFDTRVNKIIVDPFDSRNIYLGILTGGLYKATEKGKVVEDLNKAMKDFKSAKTYYDFDLSRSSKNIIVYANKFGLLRSLDGGVTWSEVKILTPPATETIYSVAIDPSNANYLYYSTDTAVYKTIDGGKNWVVKKTPTTRVVSSILVHPKEGNKILVGVKEAVQ